ncbi:hypothetical protein BDF22DRAFT_501921 [Syncephalis plumigaleata]|nr:hypothetical protein BDF22DRAFT_501921 [Syncephalis plumigaleata]
MIESTDHLVKDLDIEQALEWMEGYLTIELYPCIFSPTDDARDDLLLESRCMSLRLLHVGLEHLGVSVSEESQPILSFMVEEVRRVLTMMDRRHPPLDKLEAVIELHEIIVKELSNGRLNLNLLSTTESNTKKSKDSPDHSVSPSSSSSISRKSTSTSNTSNASNADQLFPLLVYLIIQTIPAHLISNIRYIQRYRHRDALKSKYAYCLTNMFAAISFLETIDMKALGLIPATESLPSSTDTGTITTSDSVHLEKERAASVFSVPTLPIPESSQPMIAAAFKGGRDATVAVAGGVNKAITGAVDIGFSVFGRLLNARGTAAIPTSVVGNAPPSITGTMSDAASIRSETSQRLLSIDTKKEKEAPRSMASVSSTVNTNVVVTTQQDSSVESTMTAIAATTSLSPEVKSSVELDVCHVLPPIRRFVDCAIEDLKVNDVAELLEDYKRLASVVDVYRLELAKRKQ